MDVFQSGSLINTLSGKSISIVKPIDGTGACCLYLVDIDGERAVLKWYRPHGMGRNPKELYEMLRHKMEIGPPGQEFIWPLDVTEWIDESFGYIIRQFPDGYYDLTDFMMQKARFASFRTKIDAAMNIVSSFRSLHNIGFSFQDLTDESIYINPETGRVLIPDDDSLVLHSVNTGILGTPRYMAPEIVMGKKMPDMLSDRYSMSIILFLLFCMTHPLEGKRYLAAWLTPALQEKIYNSEALFIMDQNDQSNAPDPRIQKYTIAIWAVLPEYVRSLFQKAFSQEAIHNPKCRVSELEWIDTLIHFRCDIVDCECGNEVFMKNAVNCICNKCGKNVSVPFRLEFENYSVPCAKGARLYRCQFGGCFSDEALSPMGMIVANRDASVLGIRNLSNNSWDAITSKGETREVPPKSVIPLKDGIRFTAGTQSVIIRAN